ncbi:MAG: hypothetical protein AAGJ40_00055 [Planctomycetota bacterium]
MARKTDHFTESDLRKALRAVARKQDANGGNMILWHDAENIRRLRDACRQDPEKSVMDVATEIALGFEVL